MHSSKAALVLALMGSTKVLAHDSLTIDPNGTGGRLNTTAWTSQEDSGTLETPATNASEVPQFCPPMPSCIRHMCSPCLPPRVEQSLEAHLNTTAWTSQEDSGTLETLGTNASEFSDTVCTWRLCRPDWCDACRVPVPALEARAAFMEEQATTTTQINVNTRAQLGTTVLVEPGHSSTEQRVLVTPGVTTTKYGWQYWPQTETIIQIGDENVPGPKATTIFLGGSETSVAKPSWATVKYPSNDSSLRFHIEAGMSAVAIAVVLILVMV